MAYLVYRQSDEELKAAYIKYVDNLAKKIAAEKKRRCWLRAQLKRGDPTRRFFNGELTMEKLNELLNQQFFDAAKGKGRAKSTIMSLEQFIADQRAQEDFEREQSRSIYLLHGPGGPGRDFPLLDAACKVYAS